MKAFTAHTIARAMLILAGKRSCSVITRASGETREVVNYWLIKMREEGMTDRCARHGIGSGYEWWLTDKGQSFAIAKPQELDSRTIDSRYDHRCLSAAMGMHHQVTPPPGRVHILSGRAPR